MKTFSTKHTLMTRISNRTFNSQKLTNLGSFTNKTNGFMAVKDHKPGISMIVDISKDFKTVKYHPIKRANGSFFLSTHANSITAKGTRYYIATMHSVVDGPTVIEVDNQGKVLKEYNYYSSDGSRLETSAIDYFGKINGKDCFIFKTGYRYNADSSMKSPCFDLVRLDGDRFVSTGVQITVDSFVPVGYIDNDVTYNKSKKRLYFTFFEWENGKIKKSYIYEYKLNNVSYSHTLKTVKLWKTEAQDSDLGKFEVESFLMCGNKRYVVANTGKDGDGLFRLIEK